MALARKKKEKVRTAKQEQDAMIFNQVFIQPRAERLNELIEENEI
jgi:hypothetical protein